MRIDLGEKLKYNRLIKADAHAVSTVTGTAIDSRTSRNAMLLIEVGDVGGGGTVDIVIEECDTFGGTYTTHTTVAQIDEAGFTTQQIQDYKRFIRAKATIGTNAVDASVSVVLGNLRDTASTEITS